MTSMSSAHGDRVCLAGGATERSNSDEASGQFDARDHAWLRFAVLLQLTLVAAAIPLGFDLAVVVVSAGGAAVMLLLQQRDVAAEFEPKPAPVDRNAAFTARHQVSADVTTVAAPCIAQPISPRRDADVVWTDIMGQISHELRTPLNAIIGFSDLMGCELYGPVGDPRYQEYLGHIRASGRSLLKSAEDTLALTQLLAQRGPETGAGIVGLEDLIAHSISRADAPVQFDRTAARGLDVQGERRALDQIVLNVVAEALDRASVRDAVTVSVREAGDIVLIVVRSPVAGHATAGASLRLALARMMLELSGGHLAQTDDGEVWQAVIGLDLVRQPDLFRL